MGSKWFEDSFNALPGCGFMFEVEHCLRQIGRQRQMKLAPPSVTLNYLRYGCIAAHSCVPNGEYNHTRSTRGRTLHMTRKSLPDSHAYRSRTHHMALNTSEYIASASSATCHAVGVSFGALGPPYIAHIQELIRLEPRVHLVVHVRTNFVKHAMSYLRTSCDGEVNHLSTSQEARRRSSRQGVRLHVPPALLVMKALTVARAQDRLLKDADAIRNSSSTVCCLPSRQTCSVDVYALARK